MQRGNAIVESELGLERGDQAAENQQSEAGRLTVDTHGAQHGSNTAGCERGPELVVNNKWGDQQSWGPLLTGASAELGLLLSSGSAERGY